MKKPACPIVLVAALVCQAPALIQAQEAACLPGTSPWENRGDSQTAARAMVEGLHRFCDRMLAESVAQRAQQWRRDSSSPEAYAASVEPNRQRLARLIGAVEPRMAEVTMELLGTTDSPALIAEAERFQVFAVRWGVYDDVNGEGLLLEPRKPARANMVVLPDCDVSPEQVVGLVEGLKPGNQVARLLAESGCRVVVPTLLDRSCEFSGIPDVRMTNLTHREWIWRQGFETGRHPIGYEVEKVRAVIDWFSRAGQPDLPIGVAGHGEGGLLALHASALDTRIDATWVAGYFGPRENLWMEPVYRDIWGLLAEFGDAELASLILPRDLQVEFCEGPEVTGPPPAVGNRADAASGRLTTPLPVDTAAELARIGTLAEGMAIPSIPLLAPGPLPSWNETDAARRTFLIAKLGIDPSLQKVAHELRPFLNQSAGPTEAKWIHKSESLPDPGARMRRQVQELVDHTQALLRGSEYRRNEVWKQTDRSNPEAWAQSVKPLREQFWDQLIGKLPAATEPLKAHTIKVLDEPNFTGYAVELPVWPDVVASGILLLPKDLKPGEKRPVVVCQHGLEGTPQEVVDSRVESPYHGYGARLADLGYIVYAPQNPYIGNDRFRQLQRKLHPLGQSLFAVIIRQHERTLQWLKSQPGVDPERIAFYGLSYGGKTAMRVPAVLTDYCLSICSADFNEWVVKCTNLYRPMSYLYTVEYDMYEWDLASGFNYAEMAGLIAPRPFMVERGHFDGVAPDEWIGYEFAKVKRTYDLLGLADRCEITYFNGPHEIKGEATFDFLARHLNWPRGRAQP